MAEINVRQWRGSLATTVAHEELKPGDFVEMENFIYDADGFPMTRGGRRAWCTTGEMGDGDAEGGGDDDAAVDGLYHYTAGWVGRASRDFLMGVHSGKVWAADGRATFSKILEGLTPRCSPSFTTLKGSLIMSFDSPAIDSMYIWSGLDDAVAMKAQSQETGAPYLGVPDGATTVVTYANRVWAVDRSDDSALHCSALNNPQGWDFNAPAYHAYRGERFYVSPGDGNRITALVPGFAGELLIFKDGPRGGAIYRLQGTSPDDFKIVPLSTSIGAVSHRLVSQVGDREIYFCSRRGIHALSRVEQFGDLESSFIDQAISDVWRNVPLHHKKYAVCADDLAHDTWWLFIDTDGDTINDKGYLFNYRHRDAKGNPRISSVDFGANAACNYGDASGKEHFLTGSVDDTGTAYIEHCPEANDDGTDFEWSVTLAPIDAGDARMLKAWRRFWLTFDNWGYADMTLTYWGDNRPPKTIDISMNPEDVPVPHGGHHSGEVRGIPTQIDGIIAEFLQEGGRRLNLKISGTRGKLKLRSLGLEVDVGRRDVTAGKWFPYTHTRQR